VGLCADESFTFWDFGPGLSRPFLALSLWLQFKVYGATLISAAIESNLACAQYLATLIQDSDDFELLAPLQLSIVCFRFRLRTGNSYLSNASVHGQFALRACVLNYRTTTQDMERLLEDVRDASRYRFSQ
jgi:glutamate/tyrosine decarboxylase-like PLP-dependent enzyme